MREWSTARGTPAHVTLLSCCRMLLLDEPDVAAAPGGLAVASPPAPP
jgi:hypothetical protein